MKVQVKIIYKFDMYHRRQPSKQVAIRLFLCGNHNRSRKSSRSMFR